MKSVLFVSVATAAVAATADAGFVGFVANTRSISGYTVIDVFAAVSNSNDKFLNVYNCNASAMSGFVQGSTMADKSWKPDATGFTSTRDSLDSFMTAGTFSGGAYGGVYYASANTAGDPNFSGTSWNTTPGAAAATSVPANAGWYTSNPTSIDNKAESLSGLSNRTNSSYTIVGGGSGSGTSASATYGIWVAHLVVNGSATLGVDVWFGARASIKDYVTGNANQGQSGWVPAPGAVALLGVAGLASSRRRRD